MRFPFGSKEIQRSNIDFKEVYKWIMSPLISRALNVPANLDGRFLINVNFCRRESPIEGDPLLEQRIIEHIQNDLDGIGIGNNNRRNNKHNFKKGGGHVFGENKAVKSGSNKGAEQLVQ